MVITPEVLEVGVAQLTLAPSGSKMLKLTAPLGAAAPVVPVTFALSITDPPRVGAGVLVRRTVGATRKTEVIGEAAEMVL